MNGVLMIAFHYPPFQGSSGMLRTWNFSRYLPGRGWQPLILTASPRAYGKLEVSSGVLEPPSNVRIWRTFALDTARHLSIAGRYLRWMALPDRWVSWYVPAFVRALRIVHQYRPRVIWSTYPIASAHLVALTVQRVTGLPWVADFRDSMTEETYPADPAEREVYRWIERRTIDSARAIVFTTEGTRRMYAARYGTARAARFVVVPNGYDEESFRRAELAVRSASRSADRSPVTLLHSGILYPSERDPRPFFEALAQLKATGEITAGDLRVVLRASGHDAFLRALIDGHGIGDIVVLAPPIGYEAALAEMLNAGALLLLQAANCNHQIPAKLYEYLRSARPIFALTDARGDTAAALREAGIDTVADIASTSDILTKLPAFLRAVRTATAPRADPQVVRRFSRESQTGNLAELFAGVIATAS